MVDPIRQNALHDAMEAMFFGYRAFTDRADRVLDAQGLGRVHHRILYFVGRRPGVSVKGLLEILAVSKQAINAPLRRLVELDLIAVTADKADGRMKNLQLTPQGRSLEGELSGAQTEHLSRAFEASGAAAEAGWLRVMRALSAHRAISGL